MWILLESLILLALLAPTTNVRGTRGSGYYFQGSDHEDCDKPVWQDYGADRKAVR